MHYPARTSLPGRFGPLERYPALALHYPAEIFRLEINRLPGFTFAHPAEPQRPSRRIFLPAEFSTYRSVQGKGKKPPTVYPAEKPIETPERCPETYWHRPFGNPSALTLS